MLLHVCRLRCLLQNNSTMRPSPPTHPSSQPSPQHPQPPPPPHSQMMSTQVSAIQHTLSLMKDYLFHTHYTTSLYTQNRLFNVTVFLSMLFSLSKFLFVCYFFFFHVYLIMKEQLQKCYPNKC